ncbi:CMP/dCMP deaminase, zinc-binding [Artemisia annua]|uniref:tRNA(adenine(34)) deaminase n=1 Tax=Artemisia annua TaxID=35608 RepID=A0A2U1N7U5_ARTAN|nr:CMP/dCMP deaminase, zinc-binding [Artemisia annua]
MFYGNAFGRSAFNVLDRSYYYKKISDVKERSKYGKKGYVQKRKTQILSSNVSDSYVDDVEVMLSLLTNEVDLECMGFKDGKRITKKGICGDEVVKVKSLTSNENLDMRNEGSCGQLEGDKDFEVECGGYVGQTSSDEYKKDLGEDHKVCIHEIVDNIGKPPECVEEQGKLLEKKDTVKGNYGGLVGVSHDYRKKSEKKLNEKFSQHESNVSLNIGEECRQHSHEVDKISDDSGSEMKYKRFADKGKSVVELNSSTEKKLKVISEVSKSQEIGNRGTPSLSESRIKSFEEKSTEVKDQIKDSREEHLKKYEKSRQIIGISDTHFSNRNAEDDAKVTKTSIEGNNSGPGMISVEEGPRPKGGGSRQSSQGSGPNGPSDEMWHVTDASTSTQDPSEPDTQDNMSDISENGELAKPSGKSLWTIIGDVVRLNWNSPRSESHTPNSRGAKGSSYMSASSENWFSSHDPDDSNDENVKKQITKGLDSPLADGPSKSIFLPIIKESPFPLPATQMTRSPATKKTKNSGELKRRLEPKDQVTNHNFDEWEEAYGIEAKQRKIDEMFMTEALLEAKKAADAWEVPVGAVLVKDGKIIARGYNLVEELRDSTAHAEMICIRKASTNLRSWRLMDTTLYVTLEPCPMCAGAILQARIDTVVWGAPNKLLGADGNEYKKDLGEDHKVSIHEIVDNIGKPPECVEEQGKLLEKKDTVKGNFGGLVGVSHDYRKKSEKKLNEKFSQHESNVSLNIGEECRQHSHEVDKISDDSGSEMKYKRFADKGKSVVELNSSTEKKLKVISEVLKSQEIGNRGTPSLSESRIKSFEEKSTEVKDQIKDSREEHLKKYEKSQQIIGISDTHFSNRNAEDDAKVTKTSIEGNNSGPGMISVEEGPRPKGGGSRQSSQGSGPNGPSDEMWHVTDASTSTQDPSEPDTQDNMSDISENGELAKPSGKSLWTIIGDVVRLNWNSPRSESHTPNSRGAKGSSYMSASSENWFSSHDPDDSNDENVKKQITKGLDSPLANGPSKSIFLPIIKESPFPLPATQMTRSPATKKTKNSGELKRRLEPKDQVTNHNFDEWEEAYGIEAKQRKIDEMFMTEALLEAKKAADAWEVPVGAVLVKDGKIIARGYNLVEELRDSTAHAEMICIRKASTNLRSWRLMDTTLYVTLEPCPMCAGAILQARIDTVVWGAPNKLLGADGSWVRLFCDGDGGNGSQPTDKPPAPQHPFHPNMVVRRGVLAAECAEIMQNFFRLRRSKKREPEPITPPSSITASHNRHQSNFFSKVQHAFKIIFCL